MFEFIDETDLTTLNPWTGVLAHEDRWTDDGRLIEAGALDLGELTVHLPVFDVRENNIDLGRIGTIDELWRNGNDIRGRGVVDLPPGRYTIGIDVIVDNDDMTFESDDDFRDDDGVNTFNLGRLRVTRGKVMRACVDSCPAWPDTFIDVT
jgi:hypothetical protein